MATMYELTADYARLIDLYDAVETDDERAEILAQIDALNDGIASKAENYARVIRNKLAEAEMYATEAKRLTQRQKSAENAAKALKERLLDAMKTAGASEIGTSIGTWRTRTNPWSVNVTSEADVPAEYRIPQPDKIDKTAIKKHFLETGELLPGVEMEQSMGLVFR